MWTLLAIACIFPVFTTVRTETPTVSQSRGERFSIQEGIKGNYYTYEVTDVPSRKICGYHCLQYSDCLFAQFIPTTNKCQIFTYNNNFAFTYPYDNSGDQRVLLRTQKSISRVVHVRHEQGINKYTSADGNSVCSFLGGTFATYDDLVAGYNAGYMNHGSCVHSASGIYYVLQYLIEGIGYQGVNGCSPQTYADIFCKLP